MARGDLYYNSTSGRLHRGRARRERTSGGFSVVDWGALLVSTIIAVGLFLSWLARFVPPAGYGILSSSGLIFPILFAADFLCLLYWIVRFRWGFFVSAVPFLLGIFGIGMFFRPQLTESYADFSRDRSTFKVMTYNVRGMMSELGGGRLTSSMRQVVGVIDSLRPDVLCMQEFQSTVQNPRTIFDGQLPNFHYSRAQYSIAGSAPEYGWGVAIYSKFPIARSGFVDFEGSNNSILWADIARGRDTVRVFNAHLQTTAIKVEDEKYVVDMEFVSDSTRTTQMRKMVDRLTSNDILRAAQADTLAVRVAASPYPVVVCGDFNDTPGSYSYRRASRRLRDSFREAGRGYGYTYRGFFNFLRIDYVLHSRDLECVEYLSPSFDCSDHNPVAVRLKFF